MSPRQVGSGLATAEADACARILAAQFTGDAVGLRTARRQFDDAYGRRSAVGAGGGRGFSAGQISALLGQVPGALALSVVSASACGQGEAADVLVECHGGRIVRIEIKAQTTRPLFKHLQNADWIRGETDFLGALVETDPAASGHLTAALRDAVDGAYVREHGWGLSALWAADVAGLTSSAVRRRLGVLTPADLTSFVASKYVVHTTQQGLRMYRLADVPNLTSGLAGRVSYALIGPRSGSLLTVRTRGDGQTPRRGGIHLTYYLGQNNRPDHGGHHMHEAFFAGAAPALTVRPRRSP